MSVRYLTIDDMRTLAMTLAKEMFARYGEPMPGFDEAGNQLGKLEAALYSPQQTFEGHELYPTLAEKAAILFYGIVKAHALQNGNKRIACTSLIVFLVINGHEFTFGPQELEEMVIRVAASPASESKAIQHNLCTWIERHIKPAMTT